MRPEVWSFQPWQVESRKAECSRASEYSGWHRRSSGAIGVWRPLRTSSQLGGWSEKQFLVLKIVATGQCRNSSRFWTLSANENWLPAKFSFCSTTTPALRGGFFVWAPGSRSLLPQHRRCSAACLGRNPAKRRSQLSRAPNFSSAKRILTRFKALNHVEQSQCIGTSKQTQHRSIAMPC